MESVEYDDMPPLEDYTATAREEMEYDHGLTLKGGGLDLNELKSENEVQFEVDCEGNDDSFDPATYFNDANLLDNLNPECASVPNDSKSSNMTPFEVMASRMTDISGDKGIMKEIVRNGTGPVASKGAIVRVHYNSYLEYSDEPFDSSRLRGKQTKCRLGEGCIYGWDFSITTMKKGEISRFLVVPEYAYRELGIPPRIPANATILFEIELIDFIDENAADCVTQMTEAERKRSSFEDIYKAADILRQVGNDAFKQNQLKRALSKYNRACNNLECANLKDEQDQQLMEEMSVKLYLNSSLCCLKLKRFAEAKRYALKVLELDKNNVKAEYRLGKAFSHMSEFDSAKAHLIKAAKLAPSDEDIAREIRLLDSRVLKHKENEKRMCENIFAQ